MTVAASSYEGRQVSPGNRSIIQVSTAISLRIVGRSPQIVRTGVAIAEATLKNTPVLLVGAPGTGKRFLARLMHELGPFCTRPFIVLSGADSDIDAAKLRRIVEDATNATLFVDAIECLSVEMQELLYQFAFVDQSNAPARVFACSERMLDSDVASGHFRSELFEPFVKDVICVPSLHDRSDDLPELIQHFFDLSASRARRTDLRGLSPEARLVLESHVFFDNARGLEHAVEHAVAFAHGPYVTMADLPSEMRKSEPVDMSLLLRSLPANGVDLKNAVESFETRIILQALERTGWNKNRAAQLLGVNRTTLVEMIKRKHLVPPSGLRRPSFRDGAQAPEELAAE